MKIKKFVRIRPVVDHYKQTRILGTGTFSTVHLVVNTLLEEQRAMKIINKANSNSKREVDLLRTLSHPNIFEVYETLEDSSKYYIVGEYLRGKELFEHISVRKTFPEEQALTIVFQVLKVLNYMHKQNLIHRDIKPENILFKNYKESQEIKLIDFGSATKVEYVSQICRDFEGTSYYIAPEIFASKYNEKCDVWSAGIVLYILLCGYPPFNATRKDLIYKMIMSNTVYFDSEDWTGKSKEVIDLIKHMLSKNPDNRYSAKEALDHPVFEQFRGNRPIKKETIDKLEDFAYSTCLRKMLLFFIACQLDVTNEKKRAKKEFNKLEDRFSGYISLSSWSEGLKQAGFEGDSKEIFKNVNLDGGGYISYTEFCAALIGDEKILTEELASRAFKMLDKVRF